MSANPSNTAPAGRRIAIVTPVLDDWQSLDKLIGEIGALSDLASDHVSIVAVDDGSNDYKRPSADGLKGAVRSIVVLRLKANQSHQRAIALGLAYVYREMPDAITVVMDSDGEDRPDELSSLLRSHAAGPDRIVVARRRKRSEGAQFRLGYFVYKTLFSLLTGKHISFGNFSLIPPGRLKNILFNTNIWNNFAATMLRSRVPIEFVDTDRGKRYFGASRMNFTSLMAHGMSAISVFSDLVISRMIIGLAVMFGLFLLVVAGVVVAKIITAAHPIPGLFIPGYTTNLILSMTNILVSSLFVGLMVILILLAGRTQVAALPTRLFDDLVDEVDVMLVRPSIALRV